MRRFAAPAATCRSIISSMGRPRGSAATPATVQWLRRVRWCSCRAAGPSTDEAGSLDGLDDLMVAALTQTPFTSSATSLASSAADPSAAHLFDSPYNGSGDGPRLQAVQLLCEFARVVEGSADGAVLGLSGSAVSATDHVDAAFVKWGFAERRRRWRFLPALVELRATAERLALEASFQVTKQGDGGGLLLSSTSADTVAPNSSPTPRPRRSPFFTPTKPKHYHSASAETHAQAPEQVVEGLQILSGLAKLPPTALWLRMLRVLLRMPTSVVAPSLNSKTAPRPGTREPGPLLDRATETADPDERHALAVIADLLNGASVSDLLGAAADGGSIDRCTWRTHAWERAGLRGLHFSAVTARGVSLRGCDLRGVVFGSACRFIHCDFEGACLDGATIIIDPLAPLSTGPDVIHPQNSFSSSFNKRTGSVFQGCSFRRASLGGLTVQVTAPPSSPRHAQKMLPGNMNEAAAAPAKLKIAPAFSGCDFDLAVLTGFRLLGPMGRRAAAIDAAFDNCRNVPRQER